nr:hypothetical protein [Tanacetum cinerariifolium]
FLSLGGEMDESMENPCFNEEEELNEFMDDGQDEEVEEWLMASVTPPRATERLVVLEKRLTRPPTGP